MTQHLLAAFFLVFPATDLQSRAQGLSVDQLESPHNLQRWKFATDEQSGTSTGRLSLATGHEGRGAVLAYHFTCADPMHCGHYVAAIWKPQHPLNTAKGAVLSLWVRPSPDVGLTIQITDETGHKLRIRINTPMLEHLTADEWLSVIVPITDTATEPWDGGKGGDVSGGVVEIAIRAESRYGEPADGELAFDDVQVIRTKETSFRLDKAAALIKPAEVTAGLRAGLGVNIHSLNDDPGLDLVRAAGFGFVRVELLWAEVEKGGEYDFAPFDELMRALEARGLGVLWLLAYGHPEHGGKSPRTTEDIAAYARYAAAAVAHFGGHLARFEIWNEPNSKQFFTNAALYPLLLRTALDAIRRENPEAAVSTGGTSGFDFPFLSSMLKTGSAQSATAIAVHPYREAGPETIAADLSRLRGLIERTAGPNKQVWNTEWGYSSYDGNSRTDGHRRLDRERQAVLGVRECLTSWVLGIPITVLYDLRDDGSNPFNREDNFGLIDQNNKDKPAMKAVRMLTSTIQQRTYSGLIRDIPYGLHAVRLDGPNDEVFVIWNEEAGSRSRIRFPSSEVLSVRNLYGESLVSEHEEIVLEEADGPIYLQLKRS